MTDQSPPPAARSRARRIAVVLAALAAIAVGVVLLLHAPFVRRAALDYVIPTVEQQYGIRLQASRLDYNVAALRIGLADLRLSALHSIEEPFFTADYVSVTLPWNALRGDVAFEDISASNARVAVRRREDGTTNLPPASDTPAGDPPPLRIGRLDIPQLSLDLRDSRAIAFLWVPSMALRLTPDDGYVRLVRPAELNTETQLTRISRFEGDASFDGRALHFANVQLQAPEASVQIDGSYTLIAREQQLDLRLRGTADAMRVARWVVVTGALPAGAVAFDAEVTGPVDNLTTTATVTSDRLVWQQLPLTNLALRTRMTTAAADVEELRFGYGGGAVTASGVLPFDADAGGRVSASWTAIDLASSVLALTPGTALVPAGAMSGQLDAQGMGPDLTQWSGSARARVAPGGNARGRIAVAGDVAIALTDGAWSVDGRPRVGGVASTVVTARGDLDGNSAGTIQLAETSLTALAAVLRSTGLADIEDGTVTGGTLAGDVRFAGLLADPQVDGRARIRDLAAPSIGVPLLEAEFSGRAAAFAKASAPRAQPSLDFTITAPEASIGDQPLADLRAAGTLRDADLVLDELSAHQPSSTGILTARGTYGVRTGQYTVALEGDEWRLMPSIDLPLAGTATVRFMGTGTTDDPRGTGQASVRQAIWDETALGDIDAVVTLEARTALVTAAAPDFASTLDARVSLEAPYVAVIDGQAQGLDLARLLQGIETPAPIAGTTSVTVHAEGPLESWRRGSAALDVTSLEATAGDLRLGLRDPARLRYENEIVHVDRLEASAGDVSLSASGSLGAFETAADAPGILVTATGDVNDVARAIAATGLTELPITGGDGPVALLARVTGIVQAPVVAADLELGPGAISLQDLPPISGLRVRAHAEEGWVELREAAASYEGAEISATGKAPIALIMGGPGPSASGAGEAVIHARATNLTPAVLSAFVDPGTLDELSGSIDATLDATASSLELADVTGELRIDRFDLRVADLPVTQRVPTRIVARDGFARVEAWEWVGQGATLAVRGQVRLEDRQAAILANGVVDLRMLTPFVRAAGMTTAGRLEPRLSLTGTLDNPRIDGDMVISDGEIRLADPRVLVSDLAVRTVITRTTAHITALTGSVNGGTLTGEGTLEYTPERGFEMELSTDIRGAAMDVPPGLRSEVDAALALSLNSGNVGTGDVGTGLQTRPSPQASDFAGRLSGTVTVRRGTYREPLAVVTGLLAGLRAQRLAATAESSPLLDALALDLRVLTDEDIFVDNNYGRFQLGADLRLIGTAAAPSLSGRADLREGGQLFVGRNVYTVNFGAIDFTNPVVIEPILNVEAETRAGGEDIEVSIMGPAESPTVTLRSSSNPELGQAEVASLLLTGRRLEDLAPGDAAFVGTQVLGNFSAEVLGFASRAVGLDTLRLGGVDNQTFRRDPTAVAVELDPTTRLTFGKSLGSDVDVTLSQSLRDGDAQTWIVEYLPARGLELRLVSDDEDLRSYGFRHDVAWGSGRRAGAATAQQRQELRVTSVNLSGTLVLPEPRVLDTLRVKAGDRFDFGAWQDDRDRLEILYREAGHLAARIAARRTEQDGGVALAYDVDAGPQTRIEVTGIDVDNDLRASLESAWSQSVFDDFLIDEAGQIVRGELARQGYFQPMVDVRVRDGGATKTLAIAVTRGTRSVQTIVRIDGVEEPLADDIETDLAARGVIENAIANPGAIEREATAFLRARGHLRARVMVGAPLFEDATAVLPVRVDAGPVFSVAAVTFEGARSLDDELLRDAVAIDQGTPYDPGAVDAARARLVALYRREGFAAATVTARPDVRADAPGVDVAFVIDEDARQVLNDIIVTGTRAIDPDVVLGALDLEIGAPLRSDDLLRARTRVFDTGLFRRIDVTSEPADAGGQPGPVDPAQSTVLPMRLRVGVEEWPAVRLRYGFVVAEERPEARIEGRELVPGLSADVTRRTLFGRAIAVGSALELQRREQRGRVFLNAPTFLRLPIESSLIGERSREEFQAVTLVTNRNSITWEQRARMARALTLSYSYTFERNHTFDTGPPDPFAPLFDITINIARLNGAAAWDTRDDPTDTARGLFASSTLEYAPEQVGSDIRFVRQLQQAYYFRQWRGTVFASAARLGVVTPVGGQELIVSERFFAGGSRTVRGVIEGGLGGRDFFGDPTGGQMMIVLNQEARVPLSRWIRAVGFLDAGNVFARPRDASLRDLIGSIGFGVRIATPFALLRADYGRTMSGVPENAGRWTFGIGQAF